MRNWDWGMIVEMIFPLGMCVAIFAWFGLFLFMVTNLPH